MKHQAIEEINILSFQPESGRWIAVTQSTYHSSRKTRRKFLVTALLIGSFFYLYNPMHSYQTGAIQSGADALNTVEIEPQILNIQQS